MTFEEWHEKQIKSGDFDLCSGYEYAKRAFEAGREELELETFRQKYKIAESEAIIHNFVQLLEKMPFELNEETKYLVGRAKDYLYGYGNWKG